LSTPKDVILKSFIEEERDELLSVSLFFCGGCCFRQLLNPV
jgi:hypothetical protein